MKTATLHLRLGEEQKLAFDKAADELGVSVSTWARAVLWKAAKGSGALSPVQRTIVRKRAMLTDLPADFGSSWSEPMQAWLERHANGQVKAHLLHFVGYARANGKRYADWEQAFQNAVREDWAGVRKAGL